MLFKCLMCPQQFTFVLMLNHINFILFPQVLYYRGHKKSGINKHFFSVFAITVQKEETCTNTAWKWLTQ